MTKYKEASKFNYTTSKVKIDSVNDNTDCPYMIHNENSGIGRMVG